MKARLIILDIDSIARLFRDYTGLVGFPEDGKCETLLFHPGSHRMNLRISAESLNGVEAPEEVRFDLQRTFLVN